jgi:hypothetical protein
MRIEHSARDGCIVVTLVGQLDLAAAPKVRRALWPIVSDVLPPNASGAHGPEMTAVRPSPGPCAFRTSTQQSGQRALRNG